MTDEAPKSALELALERLRKKDEASGSATLVLTDEQRQAIADVRQLCEAKIAERKILHASSLASVFDPAERAALDDAHRRDCERLVSDRDGAIARIRGGS